MMYYFVVLLCLLVCPEAYGSSSHFVRSRFKYYGAQHMWSSFMGHDEMNDYNTEILKAITVCRNSDLDYVGYTAFATPNQEPVFTYGKPSPVLTQDGDRLREAYLMDHEYYQDDNVSLDDSDTLESEEVNNVEESDISINEVYTDELTSKEEMLGDGRVEKSEENDGAEADRFFREGFIKRMKPIISNVTCILQKIGMMDENMEMKHDLLIESFTASWEPKYKVLKKQLIEGYKFCNTVGISTPTEYYLKQLFPSYPVHVLSYWRCLKEIELELMVKQKEFDEFYKYKPHFMEASDMWRDNTPTDSGIKEFFYSLGF